MHAFQRTLFHAVVLLSLGWGGCLSHEGGGTPNNAPTLTLVTATPSSIDEGASTTLSVTANDSDGDPLTYSWEQLPATPAGTFGGETGATRTWTAPMLSQNTTFTLRVTVSDGKGGSAQGTVDVAVANVPGPNHPPTVDAAITVPASVSAGDVNLSIGASDPDGDPLTYSWTVDPAGQGTFTTPTAAATQWRSPELSAATTYTFQVTVSDGTSSVTRTASVQVTAPSYASDIQPIWDAHCTGCHNSSSQGRGGLNLDPGKSYASIVNVNAAGFSCGTTSKRVVPSQPDDSLLVQKISPHPPCGSRMPADNTGYFDDHPGELTRIRSWILAGALNN